MKLCGKSLHSRCNGSVVGSILHELFLFPASQTGVIKLLYVLSCLSDGAYKRTLAANWKNLPMLQQQVSSL